jgi:hypothetical protein
MFREVMRDKKMSESAEIRSEFRFSARCARTDISKFRTREINYSHYLIYYPNTAVSVTGG